MKRPGFALLCLSAFASSALAATSGGGATDGGLLPGGNSKDPISIEADQLVYSDKDGKATYSGNVVLIQGTTKLNCSVMVLFIDKTNPQAPAAPPASAKGADKAAPPPAQPGGSNSSVKHMDCSGPVTVVSKTQTATGDSAIYDKPQNKVWLIGNVTLSDGPNVTKGDKLTYDLATGQAHVETKAQPGKPSRVWSQFVPGSDNPPAPEAAASSAKPAPKPTPAKSAGKP